MREIVGRAWIPALDMRAIDGVGAEVASAIAEELMALTGVLSNLAYDLGSDPDTLRKHMGSMQAIDLITQIQVALAEILRSDAPIDKRIEGVTVEALGRRLEARLAGKPYPVEYGEDTSLD